MTKTWNWQQPNWPEFIYDNEAIAELEQQYAGLAGEFRGALKHISHKAPNQFTIELLTHEAIETSMIEGEILERNSVQSSIQRHMGLKTIRAKSKPSEEGIAAMMTNVFQDFAKPLSHSMLFLWHEQITRGYEHLEQVGAYRTSTEPMQIISGPYGNPKIHFEAPPSIQMDEQMEKFIQWFNKTEKTLSPILRASLAHLYFVSIHPFEDGNGRISRALVEKALSQYQHSPALTNLSHIIRLKQSEYYAALERNNQKIQINDWILYLGQTIIKAQKCTLKKIELTIKKTQIYDEFKLNERQTKAVEKLFAAEPEGFEGGLSAEKYIAITDTTPSSATRDLQGLVEMGILKKEGERRYTRYHLNIKK